MKNRVCRSRFWNVVFKIFNIYLLDEVQNAVLGLGVLRLLIRLVDDVCHQEPDATLLQNAILVELEHALTWFWRVRVVSKQMQKLLDTRFWIVSMINFILCTNEFLSILNFPKPLVILKRFDNLLETFIKHTENQEDLTKWQTFEQDAWYLPIKSWLQA